MSRPATLAAALRSTKPLLTRFLVGFDDTNHTRQAPGLPNHVSWNLGHLALTMHRCAEKINAATVPADQFVTGAPGDSRRFDTESVSFGSMPKDDPARYPGTARAREIYEHAVDRLADVIAALSDADLDRQVPWGTGATISIADLAARMIFHNGTHTGQICDLRRALGMKGVLG